MKSVLLTTATFAAASVLAACGPAPAEPPSIPAPSEATGQPLPFTPEQETILGSHKAAVCIKEQLFKDNTEVSVAHSGRTVYVVDQEFYSQDGGQTHRQGEARTTKISLFFNRGFDSAYSMRYSSFTPLNPNDGNDVTTIAIMEQCVKDKLPNAMNYTALPPLPAPAALKPTSG